MPCEQERQARREVDVVVDEQDPVVAPLRCRRRARAAARSDAGAAMVGSVTVNVLPRPGPRLSAAIVPPCSSTSAARERESDAEPALRCARAASPCVNISKIARRVRRDADAVILDSHADLDRRARRRAT